MGGGSGLTRIALTCVPENGGALSSEFRMKRQRDVRTGSTM